MVEGHFAGWKAKARRDFQQSSFERELSELSSDPVYPKFGLDCPEYALVRLTGRMSISIGRRLGEIYDKLPRQIACDRFGLEPEQIAEIFAGLELDLGLRYEFLSSRDAKHIARTIAHCGGNGREAGVGIEIRYNFNPNDSARLRKDEQMVEYLKDAGMFPLYLVYSSISPREDAIARLTRAGWHFLQGDEASKFTKELFGLDFLAALESETVLKQTRKQAKLLMRDIFDSYAFNQIAKK